MAGTEGQRTRQLRLCVDHVARDRRARLELDNGARQFLCRAHDDRFGARDLARRLRAELEPALARALLECPADDTFLALLDGDRLSVVPVNR